jgi:uncharacterized membrane protein
MSRSNSKNRRRSKQSSVPVRSSQTESVRQQNSLSISRTEVRVAPIPTASELADYNQVVPDGGERIIRVWENQVAHRQSIERVQVASAVYRSWAGLFAGTAVMIIAVVGGIACILYGHDAAGVALVTASGIALYRVLTQQFRSRQEELTRRENIMK